MTESPQEGVGVFDALARHSDAYQLPIVSIRERTPEDPETYALQRIPMPRYLLFDPARPENYLSVFGQVQGGETREEAVFWAERWASKQDYHFQRPEGWENVVGALPRPEAQ